MSEAHQQRQPLQNPYKKDGHYNHPGSLMHKLAEDWERKRMTPCCRTVNAPLFAPACGVPTPRTQNVTRQTPRLSLAQVKKAAAYPSAAAARSSLRRPSVTSAPEISQLEESPIEDVPPALIRL